MDNLPGLGRETRAVIGPTYKIYGELLEKRMPLIVGKEYKTYSYGAHYRQKLDLFIPSDSAPKPPNGKARPVLVFIHGGGLVTGDRTVAEFPNGLIYRNMGYFFSEELGYETIIAGYRIIKHGAAAPSGNEDIDGVLKWITNYYTQQRDVFIMGNSAGGILLASWFFGENMDPSSKAIMERNGKIRLGGIILLGAPLVLGNVAGAAPFIRYHGSTELAKHNEPFDIIQRAIKHMISTNPNSWPPVLVLVSEFDIDGLSEQGQQVVENLKDAGCNASYELLKGHNHISPPSALGTGIRREEQWAFDVAKWINSTM